MSYFTRSAVTLHDSLLIALAMQSKRANDDDANFARQSCQCDIRCILIGVANFAALLTRNAVRDMKMRYAAFTKFRRRIEDLHIIAYRCQFTNAFYDCVLFYIQSMPVLA